MRNECARGGRRHLETSPPPHRTICLPELTNFAFYFSFVLMCRFQLEDPTKIFSPVQCILLFPSRSQEMRIVSEKALFILELDRNSYLGHLGNLVK